MVNEDIRMRNWDGTQVRRQGEAQWHKPNQEEIEMIQEYERNEEEEEALLLTAAEEEEILKAQEEWEAHQRGEGRLHDEDETRQDDSYQEAKPRQRPS